MDLISELIDVGVDILNPIQVSAKNMDIHFLKSTYGQKLSFHGGIDVQQVLPKYTPQQVAQNVKETIDILGKGGGYILAPTHNIQFDTPIENILRMYETAQNRVIAR